jgi:hypothetical protein
LQFVIGVLSAGAVQFGLLAGTGATGLILTAGVVGAMGTAAAGLLKQLPRETWSEEKRDAKQEVTDAKEVVQQVARDEKEIS